MIARQMKLPYSERDAANHDADVIEHNVEQDAEHRTGSLQPRDFSIHAVEDEADVVQNRTRQKGDGAADIEVVRSQHAEYKRHDGDLVRCDVRVIGDWYD